MAIPRGPLNVDQRVWAVEQYDALAAEYAKLKVWIDQLPPAMQPPGWPSSESPLAPETKLITSEEPIS